MVKCMYGICNFVTIIKTSLDFIKMYIVHMFYCRKGNSEIIHDKIKVK